MQEVKSDDSSGVRVSHTANAAKLVVSKAGRTAAGCYVLKAENQFGKDEARVEVCVAGRPGKPEGPLKVSDVTRKTCTLSWSPPADDGGQPITAYEVEKLDPYVEQWVPVGSTKDTSLKVRNLGEGKPYQFLVRAVSSEGDSGDLVRTYK